MLGNKRMCMFLALGSIASIYAENILRPLQVNEFNGCKALGRHNFS